MNGTKSTTDAPAPGAKNTGVAPIDAPPPWEIKDTGVSTIDAPPPSEIKDERVPTIDAPPPGMRS